MSDTTESRWYKITVFIISAIVVGVTIANIVYFNRIRKGTCGAMTSGEATTMLWINVILLIITAIIFIWSLWKLIFSSEKRTQIKHYWAQPGIGIQPMMVQPTGLTTGQPVATSPTESAIITAPREAQILAAEEDYQ